MSGRRRASILRPDQNSTDPAYWKRMYYSANASRKEAWRKFFKVDRKHWRMLCSMNTQLHTDDLHIPTHIKNEYIEFIASFDEEKRECPICAEPMNVSDSTLTDCGHMYHRACLEPHVKCPTCRRSVKK